MEEKTIVLHNQIVLVTKYENGIQYEMPHINVTIAEGDTTGIPVGLEVGRTIGRGVIFLRGNKVCYVIFVCETKHAYHSVLI